MAYDYTTAQTYSQLDDVLKEFYEKAIVDLVYHKAPFWAQVKKLPAKGMQGKRVYIPVTTAYSEAVGSKVADDYQLPTPKRSSFDATYIYIHYFVFHFIINGIMGVFQSMVSPLPLPRVRAVGLTL